MRQAIAYYRVSTKGQGESGLGLEAQKTAIEAYAKSAGVNIATCYTEIESGKLADRPELGKALAHARRKKAVLVAKLDRLARNVAFLSRIMDSGCEFAAADMTGPHTLILRGHDFLLHHKYGRPGTYHVVVTVTDDDGAVGTDAFTVTVKRWPADRKNVVCAAYNASLGRSVPQDCMRGVCGSREHLGESCRALQVPMGLIYSSRELLNSPDFQLCWP
jgi:hypothetical protein